jgi:hypothetical protein
MANCGLANAVACAGNEPPAVTPRHIPRVTNEVLGAESASGVPALGLPTTTTLVSAAFTTVVKGATRSSTRAVAAVAEARVGGADPGNGGMAREGGGGIPRRGGGGTVGVFTTAATTTAAGTGSDTATGTASPTRVLVSEAAVTTVGSSIAGAPVASKSMEEATGSAAVGLGGAGGGARRVRDGGGGGGFRSALLTGLAANGGSMSNGAMYITEVDTDVQI